MEFDDKVVAEFKRLFSWSNLGSRSVLSSEFINIDHDKNHYGASPVTEQIQKRNTKRVPISKHGLMGSEHGRLVTNQD